MDIDTYLKKINCFELKNAPATLENLQKLMSGNLSQFPFENCDMQMGEFQKFSLENAYDRLVNQGKGGYCIQLNSVFNWLLKHLGYDATLQPVYCYNNFLKKYNRLPIHMTNIVKFQEESGESISYYVDVGTIRPVNEPIKVVDNVIQRKKMGIYRFKRDDKHPEYFALYRAKVGADLETCEWSIQIKLRITDPLELEKFKEMNDWVQTPEHPTNYYKNLLAKHVSACRLITLVGRKFTDTILSENDEVSTIRHIDDDDEIRRIIRDEFKIKIDYDRFKPRDDYNLDTFAQRGEEILKTEMPEPWKSYVLY